MCEMSVKGLVVFMWIWLPAVFIKGYEDICENEIFNPKCDKDHLILMIQARYGRMMFNRCVTKDYGSLGCGSDVTNVTDLKCSGRHECSIAIPESQFATNCPDDLKPYLQVSYKCVKVHSPRHMCPSGDPVILSSTSGYLAGTVTTNTNCGTETTPWIIQSKKGQHITITLYDFTVTSKRIHGYCETIANIQEEAAKGVKDIRVCKGVAREKVLLRTTSTKVKVILHNDGSDKDSFLLRYEVDGCPDIANPPTNAYIIRSDDQITFKCNFSSIEVKHKCQAGKWIGPVVNCSTGPTYMEQENIPFEVSILIVIIIALVIGLVVLLLGLLFLKRQHSLCYTRPAHNPEYTHNKDYMTASYYQTSTYASKPQTTVRGEMQPCTPLMGQQSRESPYGQTERLACGCPVYMTQDELQNQQNIHNQSFPPCSAKLSTNAADVLSNCPTANTERVVIGPDMLPLSERQIFVNTLERSPKRFSHTTFKPIHGDIREVTLPSIGKDKDSRQVNKAKDSQGAKPLLKHNSDGSGDPSDSEASAFMPRH